MKALFSAIAITTTLFLSACGGGGGGSSAGPAQVHLSIDHTKIDAGDTMSIEIEISDVNDDGIMLKIRTPLGLDYVTDSGYLVVEEIPLNFDPTFYKADEQYNYLVYFITRNLFGEDNYGRFTVVFKGTAAIAAGTVDVDTDVIETATPYSKQFDIKNPLFSAEDSVKIVVKN